MTNPFSLKIMHGIPFYLLLAAGWLISLSAAKAQQAQASDSSRLAADIELHARAAYIEALEASENGDYQKALSLLTMAYARLNKSGGANYALADTYLQLGRSSDAIYYAKRAIQVDSTNKWYHLKLVDIYEAAGRSDDALQQLNIIHRQRPHDTGILSKLAATYANAGELQKARQQYNQLLKLQGPDILLYLQKADLFSRLSMPDSLAEQLANIQKLHPREDSTFKLLRTYYQALGDSVQTNIMTQKVVGVTPENINQPPLAGRKALSQNLQTLLDQQQFEAARNMALKANEQFPQDAFFNYAAGRAWLGEGHASKAISWLGKASQLPARKPLKITILSTLGDAYAALHQPDKAKAAYKKALELDPNNPRLKEKIAH